MFFCEFLFCERGEFGFPKKILIQAQRMVSADGAADLRIGEPLRRLAPDPCHPRYPWLRTAVGLTTDNTDSTDESHLLSGP
ncbi:MAG: hypothetical protein DWI22_19565 [Planctomycetota bacterium]|nr:MAG: hypothetical protein DWI22_19565 [Planctomycetota bacterium]